MIKAHSFHIPVMGVGFSVDTPLKISRYGIDSVISIADDILLEQLRKMYCGRYDMPYEEITEKVEDYRAKRVTSYLDLIHELADRKFEEIKQATIEKGNSFKEYIAMLPDSTDIKNEFKQLMDKCPSLSEISNWLKENLTMGSIDVNIMTKVDKANFLKDEPLPSSFNDAHAAIRGFAKSSLSSSVILSAGLNPRLYGYCEHFEEFYHSPEGHVDKKIVLKVSDYRSALIQGKFFAKKGLWVSEYRVESGLNCGGHAFATDGYLLGPILAEFRDHMHELVVSVRAVMDKALEAKGRPIPVADLPLKFTVQGGVGTSEEHQFLLDHYKVDSVGWGTPFLLVKEVTNLDDETRNQLVEAKEKDLYLSNISPLGVPFNSLRGNSKDAQKFEKIKKGKPGSTCPKKYLISNTEFTEKAICPASRQYQVLKIKELDTLELEPSEYQKKFDKITEKACLCVGLGTPVLLVHDLETKRGGPGVSVCPGPNMAYFDKKMSLKEMVDHIYGRVNMMTRTDRPNMFTKELGLYINYLQDRYDETDLTSINKKQIKYLNSFVSNLEDGMDYYYSLFDDLKEAFVDSKANITSELDRFKTKLTTLGNEIKSLTLPEVVA